MAIRAAASRCESLLCRGLAVCRYTHTCSRYPSTKSPTDSTTEVEISSCFSSRLFTWSARFSFARKAPAASKRRPSLYENTYVIAFPYWPAWPS